MRTRVVDYIVQYTDPLYRVEGPVKTRIFASEEEAYRLVDDLLATRQDITDTTIMKQTSIITRERI